MKDRSRQITLATAAAVVLAFLLLALPVAKRDWTEIVASAVLGVALVGASALWRRWPAEIELGVPIGYVLVVAVLRDGGGGSTSGFAGLFLLPIIVLALFKRRGELSAGLVAMTLANVVPILAVGGPSYPSTTWRGSLVQIGVAALAGFLIQGLVSAVREQNEKLRALDRVKDEFLAAVTHELRTPLTSINGYVEMLSDDEALNESQSNFVSIINRNVSRLGRLVDDLLFIARLDEGRIELSYGAVDMAALLEQSADTARPAAAEHGVDVAIEREGETTVHADRERLAQMLDNLVSNAVKFTPRGGRVLLRATNGDGRVRVDVIDSGVGIPEAELPRLFERFFRASTARDGGAPGTGLGLAISQSIAHAHGTELDVSSEVGVGTRFSFELPVDVA
ncbi:MAG TPA: ATP-binding protein [Gaiellaceae bacterium]|nr:ATP-binding protein [Gaiellaceae bacterium]